jgi:hypothetical protein
MHLDPAPAVGGAQHTLILLQAQPPGPVAVLAVPGGKQVAISWRAGTARQARSARIIAAVSAPSGDAGLVHRSLSAGTLVGGDQISVDSDRSEVGGAAWLPQRLGPARKRVREKP